MADRSEPPTVFCPKCPDVRLELQRGLYWHEPHGKRSKECGVHAFTVAAIEAKRKPS